MDEALVHEDFETAGELLAALDASSGRWEPDPRDWVFRGQGDASWKLVPSVLRGDRWTECLDEFERKDAKPGAPLRTMMMTTGEWGAVTEFMKAADQAGLAIPEDMQDLRDSREHAKLVAASGLDSPTWPPTRLLSILAIAQHYGVPTRLLDWSWRARIATYFAVETSRKTLTAGKTLTSDRMAVWALRTRFVEFAWRSVHGEPAPIQLVTAPRATNPNLAAQAGLFTVDRLARGETCFSETVRARFAEQGGKLSTSLGPAMRKLTLPHREGAKLLRLLALDGVNAATAYPGYNGVVEGLREQRLWDFVPHPSQSKPRSP